jgi:hypothetical protein
MKNFHLFFLCHNFVLFTIQTWSLIYLQFLIGIYLIHSDLLSIKNLLYVQSSLIRL